MSKPTGAHAAARARRDELAHTIWRAVRDAGVYGLDRAALIKRVGHMGCGSHIEKTLAKLLAGRYLRKDGFRQPYLVDWDCRVPVGEEARLGPGWPALGELSEAA